jgi:1-deoxy-D-xylulose-5-phosphate synthase
VNVVRDLATVPVGKGILRRQGIRIALIAFGSMVQPALGIAEQLNATVADMRFVKPIDGDLLQELAQTHDYLVCLEENTTQGGAGSAVLESLAFSGCLKPTLLCGIPDIVTEHGDTALLMDKMGLSERALLKRIEDWLAGQQ